VFASHTVELAQGKSFQQNVLPAVSTSQTQIVNWHGEVPQCTIVSWQCQSVPGQRVLPPSAA
jgi:hypothetical protein